MIPYEWIEQAQGRIGAHVRKTPLTFDDKRGFYLKWENRQVTGSFKIRGALNKILSLEPWELQRGLVTASAGNHGQGVAVAAESRGNEIVPPQCGTDTHGRRLLTLALVDRARHDSLEEEELDALLELPDRRHPLVKAEQEIRFVSRLTA